MRHMSPMGSRVGRGPGPSARAKQSWLVAGVVIGLLAAAGAWWAVSSAREAHHRGEVASRGAQVMPFDLDRTTHVFAPRPNGGVQTVIADDPTDAQRVRLVRTHLRDEAEGFRSGDFSDPLFVHGQDMPGVADLEAGADRIDIRYEVIPAGARLQYVTLDDGLVHALHLWFEAQLDDHGEHAEHES